MTLGEEIEHAWPRTSDYTFPLCICLPTERRHAVGYAVNLQRGYTLAPSGSAADLNIKVNSKNGIGWHV